MTTRRLRQLIFTLHAWLGLHVFAVLGLIFLTGTLLVFAAEIDAMVNSERRVDTAGPVRSASFGTLYDSVLADDPGARVLEILREDTSWIGDRIRVRTAEGRERLIWAHPETGEVTGRTGLTDVRRLVFELHTSFMTDHPLINQLLTAFSLPLVLFIVTGLITYRRFWRGFFRLPRRDQTRRAWWGAIHRLLALWSLPFLVVIAATGVWYLAITLLPLEEPHFDPVATAERAAPLPAGFDGAALDRAVAAARAAFPALDIITVTLPRDTVGPIVLTGNAGELLSGPDAAGVYVHPGTQEVLGLFRSAELGIEQRLFQINDELHFGTWGGFYARIAWVVFGLLGSLLMFAGAMVYAARVADPAGTRGPGALRRIWSGMSFLRWGLPALVLAMVAVTVMRYT